MDDVNNNKSYNDELCMKLCSTIGDGMYENYKLLGDEIVDISGMSKQDIKKMVDNCTRTVKYNPDMMWFDYQALFDKTRNKVLGKTDDIKVKHTDFAKNFIARNGVFSGNEINTNMLNKALDGDLDSQNEISYSLWKYSNNDMISYNDQETVYINHLYLLTIQIALGKYNTPDYFHYLEHVNHDYLPTYFDSNSLQNKTSKLIENMNFYAITRPVMGSIFFDKNFY